MDVRLQRIDPQGEDRDALIDFLTSQRFPFHMGATISRDRAIQRINDGDLDNDENESFWIDVLTGHNQSNPPVDEVSEPRWAQQPSVPAHQEETWQRIGLVILNDLQDPTPMFDLRIHERFRGRGFGVPVLKAITEHTFASFPAAERFEGQTRHDNSAMRKVFVRSGWVKEAHYRKGWPVPGGESLDSVAYAVLRQDWENNTSTPVPWFEEPS